MAETKETKATEEKKQEIVSNGITKPSLTEDEIKEIRKQQKEACTIEIKEILKKYNCVLKSQLIINEEKTISQVFIING